MKRKEVSWTLTKKLDVFAGPGEIKKREVSWTLTKKLDTFAGPGEIKRREVVLDFFSPFYARALPCLAMAD